MQVLQDEILPQYKLGTEQDGIILRYVQSVDAQGINDSRIPGVGNGNYWCARRDSNSQPSDPKSFSVTLKSWIPCPIPKMTRRTPVSNFVECCDQYGPRPKLEPSAFLNSTRSRHSTCRSCGYDNPSLDTLRGMFVAQSIEPQTRTIAEARGIVCVEVDYDSLRGRELNDYTFFS